MKMNSAPSETICEIPPEGIPAGCDGLRDGALGAALETHLTGYPCCRARLSGSLRCRELVELVTDYLEEQLCPADRVRFEAHLVRCAGCRAYLAQLRATIRLLGSLEKKMMPLVWYRKETAR
jgi:hypothetical protein